MNSRPPCGMRRLPGAASGFVLIMVLVVVLLASMVVISLLFVLRAEHLAAAAVDCSEQARATAMSGIYHALRIAANVEGGAVDWQDEPASFQDQFVSDDGVQKWYFSVYSMTETGDIRYGLTDEARKINLYRTTEPMLEAVPNLTPPLAQSLLSALGSGGAALPAGTNPLPGPVLSPPGTNQTSVPAPALAGDGPGRPWNCLEELLQVSGFNAQLLYGSYSNLTGHSQGQFDNLSPAPSADAPGLQTPAGLRQFLTVSSYDLNQDNNGQPRLDLSQTNTDLSGLGLSTQTLAYVQALLHNGQSLAHPVELLEATNTFKDDKGVEFNLSSGIGKDQLPLLLDRCTATNQLKLTGLVNLNTASAQVLAALPGLNDSLAQAVVAAREGLSSDARQTLAWLYQEGILNADAFKQVAPWLTTRSSQFSFTVAAYAVPPGSFCVLEAVVDTAVKPPAVLSVRDVSRLGLPFNPTPAGDRL